jgi:predicted TIM-barrel fold metal-dependent hydrolase
MANDQAQTALLDATYDVDTHEMVPAQLWGDVFGDVAGRIAELMTPFFERIGINQFYAPDFPGDIEPMNYDNVWNVRGATAPSAVDLSHRRLAAMDIMGTRRSLVFSSYAIFANQFLSAGDAILRGRLELDLPEPEIRALGKAGVDEYNRYAARLTKVDPDRMRVVGYVFPNGSVADLVDQTEDLLNEGILAINIPTGSAPCGLSPADTALDDFYATLAARDVPLVLHVGSEIGFLRESCWNRAEPFRQVKLDIQEIGYDPYSMATVHLPIVNYLTAMVLGGVLERHPQLRVGAIEIGSHWLGPLAEGMDMWAGVFAKRLASYLTMRPSEYVARNIRVTPFNNFEPVETFLARFPTIQDSYCYSTDFPHIEGGKDIKSVFAERVEPLGSEVMQKFFRDNGAWLLPDLGSHRGN